GQWRGSNGAAIPERMARRWCRPLCAEPEYQCVAAVAQQHGGNRLAFDVALKIDIVARFRLVGECDMPAAGTADALDQPAGQIGCGHQRSFRMRNVRSSASRGKIHRILYAGDRIRRISEEQPVLAYIGQQIDAVFETAAADNASAIAAIS